MSTRLPLCLRLRRRALERRDELFASILRETRPRTAEEAFAVHAFAFKNDEHAFARTLLARRTELWLFRANQRAFCGDFVAVDMSAAAGARRRALVLELKLGAPLRVGNGGVQLRNAARAVRDLPLRHEAIGDPPAFTVLTGDGAALLDLLSAPRSAWPAAVGRATEA
jgi:hypothetical protein